MLLALYAASAILPLVAVVFMIMYLISMGSSQAILCTECQQCKAVCPLLPKGCNPVDIMMAAKSAGDKRALVERAGCAACGKCQEACPRGLAPYVELERWRNKQAKNTEKAKP